MGGGQGECERRFEVFVKMQENKSGVEVGGGGGLDRGGSDLGGGGPG